MKLVEFPEQTIVVAEGQPQYMPLPAYQFKDDIEGKLVCCWELTDEEIEELRRTRKIWHTVLTFNQPLQPQLLQVEKPVFPLIKPR